MYKYFVGAVFVALSSQSFAADWNGEGDLGFSQASGNSESETLTAALDLGYDTGDKWSHLLELDAFNSSQDGDRSAESYSAAFSSDYAITEKTYAAGNLRYVTDKFSGYESQAAATLTLGRNFIDDGTTLFNAELGFGYRQSELSTGEEEDEAIGTFKSTYNTAITGTTDFESGLLVESGSENTYAEGSLALRVAMSDALGLRVAYVVKHNTDVPVDTEKTDKYTTISVNYKF